MQILCALRRLEEQRAAEPEGAKGDDAGDTMDDQADSVSWQGNSNL